MNKDGANVEIDTYAFLTTTSNSLVYTIDQERMPVLPTGEEEFETWLDGSAAEAFELAREYPPEEMWIVQEGLKKEDLSQCQCIVALLNSPLRLTIGPSASVGGRPRSTLVTVNEGRTCVRSGGRRQGLYPN